MTTESSVDSNAVYKGQLLHPSIGGTSVPKACSVLALALCIIGMGLAVELTRIHVLVHTASDYRPVCAINKTINCATVAESPYSVCFGLPVSVWGIGGYLLMGWLALSSLTRETPHVGWPWGLLAALASLSVSVSAWLGFISITQIDSVCLLCVGSYLVNAALLAVCFRVLRSLPLSAWRLLSADLGAILASRWKMVITLLLGILLIGLPQALIPKYWVAEGPSRITKLGEGAGEQGHHWIGSENPKLTIIEFSDYQCPHCRVAHNRIRSFVEAHGDVVRLEHLHFPLDMACNPSIATPFHRQACELAEAAECAGRQGRFWEMNDALFSAQQNAKANRVNTSELALKLGLDQTDFQRCMAEHMGLARVRADLGEGQRMQVEGTPTFFVGDRKYLGNVPESVLAQVR